MADPIVERLPADALVLLVGPSGAGKSTSAARHLVPGAAEVAIVLREPSSSR